MAARYGDILKPQYYKYKATQSTEDHKWRGHIWPYKIKQGHIL